MTVQEAEQKRADLHRAALANPNSSQREIERAKAFFAAEGVSP